MFQGRKFRLWPKSNNTGGSVKPDDQTDKSTSGPASVGQVQLQGQAQSSQSQGQPGKTKWWKRKSHKSDSLVLEENYKKRLQELQSSYEQLQETIESLTPYKTKSVELEQKLAAVVKKYERKLQYIRETLRAAEAERDRLTATVARLKQNCANCYMCSSARRGPTAALGSQSEGKGSPLSAAEMLKRLEERHTQLLTETSRQTQRYNQCLDDIYKEVNQAMLCQQELKQECSRLRGRVVSLEEYNKELIELLRTFISQNDMNSCVAPEQMALYRNSLNQPAANQEIIHHVTQDINPASYLLLQHDESNKTFPNSDVTQRTFADDRCLIKAAESCHRLESAVNSMTDSKHDVTGKSPFNVVTSSHDQCGKDLKVEKYLLTNVKKKKVPTATLR